MKWSQTLIPTSRQVPADAQIPSHRLMLRAGLVRQVGAGLYSYLPLGFRVLHRVIEIVREEMNRAGGAEILMPALEPFEFFADTKRDVDYGDNLFRLTDRHGRQNALAPTHEEIVTDLMKAYVESYRQLPLTLYQIQTKFRDEFRPRFGVLRSREFIMKDAYSFHLTVGGPGGLNETYDRLYDAYCRIFDRCGLKYTVVEAESGPIGGSASHEFMCMTEVGEDTILISDDGEYAANVEKCAIGRREHDLDGTPTGDLERVHTPNMSTIESVGKFMKVKPEHMLKTIVWPWSRMDGAGEETGWVIAVVRGDHDVNEGKVRDALREALGFPIKVDAEADESGARSAGFHVGFMSPAASIHPSGEARDDCVVFADHDAAQAKFWATGGDEVDTHVKHFNWKREVIDRGVEVRVADIRNAAEGDPSPHANGGTLHESKGIEVGHVFKLGSKYSDAMGFQVVDERQERRSVIMGCYGIGVGRIVASAIELNHDDDGIIWPAAIAPFDVVITPIKYEGRMKDAADQLERELTEAGLEVLLDDRDERPGPKFKDADLIGVPIRLTVGDKALDQGGVEMVRRDGSLGRGEVVPLDAVVARCLESSGARNATVPAR
ncbi:MAG: proline--tRNA ligase [Phycisphaerales bacterium]